MKKIDKYAIWHSRHIKVNKMVKLLFNFPTAQLIQENYFES